jgi:hypothetical protein
VADARDDLVPATHSDLIVLDALWSGVVNDWSNEERHVKALEHAQRMGLLMELARRYGALKEDGERGAVAKKRLDAIALVATSELLATRSSPPRRSPAWLWALGVVVCAALLAVAFFYGWGARR